MECIHLNDPSYPALFRSLPGMPEKLYCEGDTSLLNEKAFAIVGTRNPSAVGLETGRWVTERCIEKGYVAVAGLALGIDTIVHTAAIWNGGKTIAVVVQLSPVSPRANEGLARSIVKSGGLLISEHAPDETIENYGKELFLRDRLQSALSYGVIPIQTGYKQTNARGNFALCGTMHTCAAAKKQGRMIFLPEVAPQELLEHKESYEGLLHLAAMKEGKWFNQQTMEKVVFDFFEKPLASF